MSHPSRSQSLALVAVAAIIAFGTPRSADAAVLAHESFDSYTPTTTLNGANGGFGFSGAWVASSSGGATSTTQAVTLSQGPVDGSPNSAQLLNGSTSSIDSFLRRPLNTISGTSPIYLGMLVQVNSFDSGSDFTLFQLTNGATGNDTQALGVGVRNGTDNPFFARAGSSGTGQTTDSSTLAVDGETYLIVAKFSQVGGQYERVDLFINPTNGNEPLTPDATATSSAVNLTQFTLFNVRTANLDNGDLVRIDELRIATSFGEAIGIPEPSSAALVGVVALAATRRRRRD